MNKIIVSISRCNVGDLLAEDIINNKGVTLVVKNTVVNQYIKNKLIELEVSRIWLYKPLESMPCLENEIKFKAIKGNYKEVVLKLKDILNDLTAGGKLEYEKILGISRSMFDMINDSSHIIRCLTEIKDSDEYTYTHCINVALYAMLIAKWLYLPKPVIQKAIHAGMLHDIGKIRIPNEILNKKGQLTPEEFEIMKKHSIYGYDFIKDMSCISDDIKNAVLLHHERIDGSGYPFKNSGSSVSLLAEIVSVADVYDAMTQNRVYKNKSTPFDAFDMFSSIGLTMFDTKVLSTFLKNLSLYYVGANVILNNGDTGEIVYVPPHNILRPIISVGSSYIDLSKEEGLKIVSLF